MCEYQHGDMVLIHGGSTYFQPRIKRASQRVDRQLLATFFSTTTLYHCSCVRIYLPTGNVRSMATAQSPVWVSTGQKLGMYRGSWILGIFLCKIMPLLPTSGRLMAWFAKLAINGMIARLTHRFEPLEHVVEAFFCP